MSENVNETDAIKIAATVFVRAEQEFELLPEALEHSKGATAAAFKNIELTLDPAPPCKWAVSDLKVEGVEIDGADVTRIYSATITVSCGENEYDDVAGFMENEGYYDADDDEFNWTAAINYMIADTTLCPDYAEFVQESVDLDLVEIG